MKEKTRKEENAYLKIRRCAYKLLTSILLWLWGVTSEPRKKLKAFFENETTKSIIQLLLLVGTIAVLFVANKQRIATNEQQEITIKLQNTANEQLRIFKERQQWLREDRERMADVYLEPTSVEPIDPDTLKITFQLVNKGNDNARDGRLSIFIADSLWPHISHATEFQSWPDTKGFSISVEDIMPGGTVYHPIKSKSPDYVLKLPLVLSLKLTPQLKKEEEIDGVILYRFCYHRGCQEIRVLPFCNPFFGEE